MILPGSGAFLLKGWLFFGGNKVMKNKIVSLLQRLKSRTTRDQSVLLQYNHLSKTYMSCESAFVVAKFFSHKLGAKPGGVKAISSPNNLLNILVLKIHYAR